MTSARDFFNAEQQEDIKMAIKHAELDTSGEIRVHIEQNCSGDVMDRAAVIFSKLGMQRTTSRNGVLIYLAVRNRRFAIIGDAGINAKVPENFWDDIKLKMLHHFRQNEFVDGLCEGIKETGEQLKAHFPFKLDDENELSDEISFGN